MYSPKPTDLAGFSVMTPQEKEISFEMRRQNLLSQEASNRAELEEQHQLELEAERIKNERLLSQLKSDNDSKIQSMKREADKNIQADRHQREALSAAMVEAERKRAEIERMSLMRIQNYKETNAQAILAALRRENAYLLRENTDLRYSPRVSPSHSPAMGPFDHTMHPAPSPLVAGRSEPPLFISRESYAVPPSTGSVRAHNALALSAIERPSSRLSSHHHQHTQHARSFSASRATPRSPAMSEASLASQDYFERPSSRSGHSRSSSAGNVYPRSPMMRDSSAFSQDSTGHLMPGSLPLRTRRTSNSNAPGSPLYRDVPSRPSSRTGSPCPGYFDLPRSNQSAGGQSPGLNKPRSYADGMPSPALSQRSVSSYASHDSSPKYSPPRNHLQMELRLPQKVSEYSRQRRSSFGHQSELQMLPAPPSRGAYEHYTSSPSHQHARALADALASEQSGLRVPRQRRRSHATASNYSPSSEFNSRYHTPVGSHTPLY